MAVLPSRAKARASLMVPKGSMCGGRGRSSCKQVVSEALYRLTPFSADSLRESRVVAVLVLCSRGTDGDCDASSASRPPSWTWAPLVLKRLVLPLSGSVVALCLCAGAVC